MSRNRKLGDVVDFIRGITFKPEDVVGVKDANAVVCMRTKNIQETLEVEDLIAVPESFVRRDELLLREGDILISSANSWNLVGKVARVPALPYRATAGGFIAIVRAKPGAIEPDYLYRWLASDSNQAVIRACGRQTTNISNLSVPRFLDLPIALPEPTDQFRAAAILDKADSLRRKCKEAMRLADEFLMAVFVDMFGAPRDVSPSLPTKPLGEVCRFYAGNSLPAGVPFAGQLDGVLHIKVGDMNLPGNESVVSSSREWSVNGAGGIIAPQGAILIPKRGGAIATNKKRVLGRPCALDPNLMAISPGPDLRQELLFQWFKLFDLSTITSGSAVPQLNKGDLAPLRIVVPPLDQQDRFAAIAQRAASIMNMQAIQLGDIESVCLALTDELLVA